MTLIKNRIQTPDGTILESRHRHDYVSHIDSVTGETYINDGGIDYMRRSINHVPAIDTSVFLEDGIELVRQELTWGSYGKSGDQPLHHIRLCDMTNDHIKACLETQSRIHPTYREAFRMELEYRRKNKIHIQDES
jgi:hypothetical protein